jgi:hypothetical protein
MATQTQNAKPEPDVLDILDKSIESESEMLMMEEVVNWRPCFLW